jgi:hypothetical protein
MVGFTRVDSGSVGGGATPWTGDGDSREGAKPPRGRGPTVGKGARLYSLLLGLSSSGLAVRSLSLFVVGGLSLWVMLSVVRGLVVCRLIRWAVDVRREV